MMNGVCNGVTHSVTYGAQNNRRTSVQNQNQNQSVLTSVRPVFGYVSHASSLCEEPGRASMHARCAGEIR